MCLRKTFFKLYVLSRHVIIPSNQLDPWRLNECLILSYSKEKFVTGNVIATDHCLDRTIGRPQREMKKRANRVKGRVICQEVPASL